MIAACAQNRKPRWCLQPGRIDILVAQGDDGLGDDAAIVAWRRRAEGCLVDLPSGQRGLALHFDDLADQADGVSA